jgi:hypothetical protein
MEEIVVTLTVEITMRPEVAEEIETVIQYVESAIESNTDWLADVTNSEITSWIQELGGTA